MEQVYKKYQFSAISIKKEVAMSFRDFAKQLSMSNTQALKAMLDFFKIHQLSPLDTMEGSLNGLEARLKQRINAAIAIIRDIEKSQTLPTMAMLQSLFESDMEAVADSDEGLNDGFDFFETKTKDQTLPDHQTTVPKIRYERLEEQLQELKADFGYVLDSVKPINNSFGKDYLKLQLTKAQLEKYKRNLKHN